MLLFHSHGLACFEHQFSHPVAVLLISFQTALSSGFSVLSLSHLASCLGTVISVAVSETCIHQENNQATSYIIKRSRVFLGLLFGPKPDPFPKQADSVIAQTFAVAPLKTQQQVSVLWVAKEGLFVSVWLPKGCLCHHRLSLCQ